MKKLPFGEGSYTFSGTPFPIVLRIMKIFTFLMFVFMTCAFGNGNAQKISLTLKNAKLEEAFNEISKQTKYKFLYNDGDIRNANRVNLQIIDKNLNEALDLLLESNGMLHEIIDETIVIKNDTKTNPSISLKETQTQTQITGTVTNADGRPLSGASIVIKGTTTGTSTNAQGQFSISANRGQILVIRYIGFITREIVVGQESKINVVMALQSDAIEEVVVTGLGMQLDRRTFSGATKKISGEATEIGGMVDPSRGLEGRVAGVSVQNVSGTFGTAPKIRVRGATSLYGSSKPLWVVDGVIFEDVADVSADQLSSGDALTLVSSAVAGLNANDIESFQILKDGAATSIYGARGMAGVIVITTKKGVVGRNVINYSGEYTSRAVPRYTEFNIMNSQQQMGVYNEMYEKGYLLFAETSNASASGVYGKLYEKIQNGEIYNDLFSGRTEVNKFLRENEMRNTNWFNQLFSNNISQNHSVSMSSGTDKAQYYASISAVLDPGWTKKNSFDRYTANLNATFNILPNLRLNLLTNGSYRSQVAPGTLGQSIDVVRGEVKRDFDINPYKYAMNTSRTLDPNENYVRNYAPFNILNELENNYMDINAGDLRFQGELSFRPIPNLNLIAFGALRYITTNQNHHIKDYSNQAMAYRWAPTTIIRDSNPLLYRDPNDPFSLPTSILPEGGIYNRTDHSLLTHNLRLTGQYNLNLLDKHYFRFFAGATVDNLRRNNTWYRAWGLQYELGEIPFQEYRAFKRSQEENSPNYSVNNSLGRDVAFFGQVNYNYKNKYILDLTGRYEGSNRLGRTTSSRWMPTWNISGAWNVHEEKFFEDWTSILSHLTVKTSYSLTGERGPGNVTNSTAVIGAYNPWRPNTFDNESGLRILQPANMNLTFEKKYEWNTGLNIGLLDNRVSMELDYFKRNNFDLIGVRNTTGISGSIARMGNVATMTSEGVELGLTAHIFRQTPVKWSSTFIYTHVKNKVTDLNTEMRVIDLITGNGFAVEGYAARSLFSIPFVGLNNEGLPQFKDENNQTTITGVYFQESKKLDVLEYSGTTEPTDLGSFENTFNYKGFRFNVLVSYFLGNVVRMNPIFKSTYSDFDANPREYANRWVIPGDEASTNIPTIASRSQNRNYPELSNAYNAFNYSTERIARGDFIRLKDVSLAYTFPEKMVAPWKLSSLSLRANATNLFLIYADKRLNGQDPEFINSGGVAAPIPRMYTLTLRVGL